MNDEICVCNHARCTETGCEFYAAGCSHQEDPETFVVGQTVIWHDCQRVTITGHGFRDATRHPAGQWAIRTADGYRGVADARDLSGFGLTAVN